MSWSLRLLWFLHASEVVEESLLQLKYMLSFFTRRCHRRNVRWQLHARSKFGSGFGSVFLNILRQSQVGTKPSERYKKKLEGVVRKRYQN